MRSAGQNLFRDLALILAVILFSKLLSNKAEDNDIVDQGRSYPRENYQEDQRFSPRDRGGVGRDLGVVDFGQIRSRSNAIVQGSASYLGNDYFITARHVVDGCRKGNIRGLYHHPNSDVSIFQKHMNLDDSLALSIKQDNVFHNGFIVGFPTGKEASAKTRYLGYAEQRIQGDFRVEGKVLVWALYDLNAKVAKLGGMSGGAVLDEKGDLIGVLSGGTLRKGRVITTTLENTKDALAANSIDYTRGYNQLSIRQNQADEYIEKGRVVKINCRS